MSRHIGKLYHPGNGHAVDVYEGFCSASEPSGQNARS